MNKFLAATPALPAAAGLIFGIVAEYYGAPFPAVALAAVLSVGLALFHRFRLAFTGLFIVLGWLASSSNHPTAVPEKYLGKELTIHGVIMKVTKTADGETTIDIRSDNSLGGGICRLRLLGDSRSYCKGDSLKITTRLHRINTEDTGSDFYENRYRASLYLADGVTAIGFAGTEDCQLTHRDRSLNTIFERCRTHINDLIMRSDADNSTAWLMQAVILGDDSGLSPDTVEQMRKVGVAHYLALSGFHVGIVALIASALFFGFKTWSRVGRWRHLLVILMVWCYAAICGMTPSLMRAAIFITIALLAKILQRQSASLNSLCVAAAISLIINPYWLFTPGFQLSFAAVAAIITMSTQLNPLGKCRSRALQHLGLFISVPVAATIGTSLITACHFHRIPLLFLPADIAIALLMPAFIAIGLIVIAATACGLHFDLGLWALNLIDKFINYICDKLAILPYAEIRGIELSSVTIFIIAGAILVFVYALHMKSRPLTYVSLATACIGIASGTLSARPTPTVIKMGGNGRRCELFAANGKHCIAINDSKDADSLSYIAEIKRRFSQYLDRRDATIENIVPHAPVGDFNLPGISRYGNYLNVGGIVVYLLFDRDRLTVSQDIKVNYLYVGRVGAIDIDSALYHIRPDTVIIASNVTHRRTSAIISSGQKLNIPCRHLTSIGHTIAIPL